MRSKHIVLGSMLVLVACSAEQSLPTESAIAIPLFARGGQTDFNIGTHLIGDEEVPPLAIPTPAQGQAIFRLNASGTSADYRLIAANIENVTQAHIHCGCFGDAGPVSVWLYGQNLNTTPTAFPSGGGLHNGVLASGTVTLAGKTCTFPTATPSQCPASVLGVTMSLLDAIRAGLAYVNVHTNDGVAPINTGPGDYPLGEIRGQLDHASSHGGS
jgi:hypothetical protein